MPLDDAPAGVDFLEGLVSRVAVEADANFAGAATTPMGYPVQDWGPVAGLESVPCAIAQASSRDLDEDARVGLQAAYTVTFAGTLALDRRHRLNVLDPITSLPRTPPEYLVCRGVAEDEQRMGHHTVVVAVRYA